MDWDLDAASTRIKHLAYGRGTIRGWVGTGGAPVGCKAYQGEALGQGPC